MQKKKTCETLLSAKNALGSWTREDCLGLHYIHRDKVRDLCALQVHSVLKICASPWRLLWSSSQVQQRKLQDDYSC